MEFGARVPDVLMPIDNGAAAHRFY